MHGFWLKLFRRRQLQRDLEAELQFHRDMSSAHQNPIRLGHSAPLKEQALDLWRFNSVENLWRDLAYAARGLRRSPALLICGLLSLSLGIGANSSIFALIDAMRLRPLPVLKPQQLAAIRIAGGNQGMGVNPGEYPELTRAIFSEIQHRQKGFSGLFAWQGDQVNLGHADDLHRVKAMFVSADFFSVLGLKPARGRLLTTEDVGPCPASTMVVSNAYWKSAMGHRPLDKAASLIVDGRPTQVVGVLPPEFLGLSIGDRFEVVLPLCQPKDVRRDVFDVSVIGRLQTGWNLKQASDQLQSVSAGIFLDTVPPDTGAQEVETYKRFRLSAYPASSGVSNLRDQYDRSLWLLLGITGLVLLIACANLANLLLARATTRDREMAVRLALGASRGRLLQQLLTEGALLSLAGAMLGLLFAQLFTRVLVLALSTEDNQIVLPLSMDWRVLLFTVATATLTCLVFATIPAHRAVKAEPVNAMKASGRGMTAGHQRFRLQRLLVVFQLAVSLVLLLGAMLFLRSFRNLVTFDPGMREAGISAAFVLLPVAPQGPREYENQVQDLLRQVRSVPGVLNAATTTNIPLVGGSWEHGVQVGSAEGLSKFTWVSPGYFKTMNIPLILGRDFDNADSSGTPRVAIVNRTFVRRYIKVGEPLGQTLRTATENHYPSTLYRIIGVIPDTKYNDIRSETPPMAFAPASQYPDPGPFAELLVYSNTPEAELMIELKRSIGQRFPGAVVTGGNFQSWIRDGMVRDRAMATLSGGFGVMAALLAIVGFYGVISYLVASRRPEIGVRLAMGASKRQVVTMVMKEAAALLAIGSLLGAVLSLLAGPSAAALLFGLKPYDPETLAAAILLLAIVSAIASFVPARLAAQLDPMIALRYE